MFYTMHLKSSGYKTETNILILLVIKAFDMAILAIGGSERKDIATPDVQLKFYWKVRGLFIRGVTMQMFRKCHSFSFVFFFLFLYRRK